MVMAITTMCNKKYASYKSIMINLKKINIDKI